MGDSYRTDAYLTVKNLARHLLWPTKLCSTLARNPQWLRQGGARLQRKRKETHQRKKEARELEGETEDKQPDEDWDGFRER